MWEYNHTDELCHYGRIGMKWGQHIYGKVKAAKTTRKRKAALAKARQAKATKKAEAEKRKSELAKGKLSTKDMTDTELKAAVARLQMEKQYKELYSSINPQKVSAGRKFVDDTILPALKESSKTLLRDYATKKGKELLGLNDVDDTAKLRKSVEKLNLQKQYKDLTSDNTLKDKVAELNLQKQYADLTKDNSLRDEVTRLTLEKQLEKLKKEN